MSGRTLLSRPRTRVYDANYNIGESYYKPALDRLDRKYSGRPLSPNRQTSLPKDLTDRHDRMFANDDLFATRRRTEKLITEPSLFDSRGARIASQHRGAFDLLENDIDEETASTLKRIRANKKVSVIDDVDMESTVNNLNSRRLLDRSEKVLRTVGLDDNSRSSNSRALKDDNSVSIKRRSLKVSYENDGSGDLTKWSSLASSGGADDEVAAASRARKSRARINDIEEEMAAMAEKQAARERRAARLKALVAESAEETEAAQSALQAVSIRSRKEHVVIED